MAERQPAVQPFGDWLAERGVVTAAQLEEARRSQSVYGGRLGTNLIELGILGLTDVAAHLTEHLGVPLAPVEWLESPDERAIALVPGALMRRLVVLPLRLERNLLHVAMLDPGNPEHMEFLATASSRRIVAYALPEVRLRYWLEVHLEIDRHPRYINLAARTRQTGLLYEDPEEATATAAPAVEAPAPAPPGIHLPDYLELPEAPPAARVAPVSREGAPAGPGPQEDDEEELLLEELVLEPADAGASPLARDAFGEPPTPARIAALEAELEGCGDRDRIVELTLELARAWCEAAAILSVRGDAVVPLRGSGGGLEEKLGGIELPVGVHSLFVLPALTRVPFRGAPPEGGIDARLLASLGRSHIGELLVLPIVIRSRVVNLLYCDNGSNALAETSVAALRTLCECTARAYARLILQRKRTR